MVDIVSKYRSVSFIGMSKNAGKTTTLNFFIEKDIGGNKFYKSFPAYIKANDKLQDAVVSASQQIEDNAGLIFKSGWWDAEECIY